MGPRLVRALLHRAATAAPDSDAELLARFSASRDEPAFAELVRRYAGLVWGQCRNLLPSEADAEDAFQATFLALARQPNAVRSAVGPYLHGVAYRVCLNARRLAGRRKRREAVAATSEAERPVADSAWDAALAAVHDELHRLPDPQRVAFVLCVLEGRGLTDAAAHLGVKLGTLSARLSRAKQALLDRLAAKGVVAGLALLGVGALAPAGATAGLMAKAVHSAVGAASEAVVSLTHGVTKMVAFKVKLLAAAVLLACGLGLGIGSGWVATAEEQPKPKASPTPIPNPTAPKPDELRVAPKLSAGEPEFRYVPLPDDHAGTTNGFEALVRDGEKGGHTFAGCVPMKGFKDSKGEATVQVLVFRKKPTEQAATVDALREYQKQLLSRYDEQKQAELLWRKRRDDLLAQQEQLQEQAKLSQAMEAKLRAEIAALEERMAAKKPAAQPEQATAQVGLVNAAETAKAITALAAVKFDGRKDALRFTVNGDVLSVQGDADAVQWVVDLIGKLKK